MGSLRCEGRPVQRYEVVPVSREAFKGQRRRAPTNRCLPTCLERISRLTVDHRARSQLGVVGAPTTGAVESPGEAVAVDCASLTCRYVRQLVPATGDGVRHVGLALVSL